MMSERVSFIEWWLGGEKKHNYRHMPEIVFFAQVVGHIIAAKKRECQNNDRHYSADRAR